MNGNEHFVIEDSKLISYIADDLHVIIPSGIRIIGEDAFYDSKIKSITIPESVSVIEESAFEACKNLTYISVPSSVQKIGGRAFMDCWNLKRVDFKCKVEDLDYSTFSNCRNLTAVSVPNSIGVCFKSLFQNVSMRHLDRRWIESDLEMIESIDNFSGTPIKRKIYDPKSKDLSTIDISEEQIDLDGDTIETIEIASENELRFKMENHLLRIKLSCEGLYFNSAGFLPPKEDMNTYVGNKALKCYVTDGYDLHSYYYHEIEQKLKSDRSEILPELYKIVIETDCNTFEILLYNAYNDWFGDEPIHIEINLDNNTVVDFSI